MGKSVLSRREFVGLMGALGVGAAATSVGLTGCGGSGTSSSDSGSSSETSGELDISNWDSVLEAAKGQTVNVHMMTGASMTEWMNDVCAKAVEEYGITWNLVPASNTVDVVNLVSSEMGAGKTEGGSVDVMWINGENFASLKDAGYLYGPFLDKLPSYQFCDPDDVNTTVDCGIQTEGYEAPFQGIWEVFWANTKDIPESEFPNSADEFKAVVQNHKGKFTYAQLGDYRGTYFVGVIICAVCGQDVWNRINQEQFEKEELKELIEPALEYLRELNPYLWNEGKSYPSDGAQVQQLFADGEISMMFSDVMPQSAMDDGTVPETTRPFFMKSGTLHDFWYMGIPKNAGNLAAALVTVNEIMTPVIQVSQFNAIGYYPFSRYDKMDEEGKKAYDEIEWTDGLIEPTEMQDYAIPQANGKNNDLIEEIWNEEVNGK